jgi:hypothetical protein
VVLKQIQGVLERAPGTKSREIAAELQLDHSQVNRVLYDNADLFERDDLFQWSVAASPVVEIKLVASQWLPTRAFEAAVSKVAARLASATRVVFTIKCKLMLESLARLLALCNQLVASNKKVTISCVGSKQSLTYLDRIGFLDLLAPQISIAPQRPAEDRSRAYRGNNDGVIEFRTIDPTAPNQEIPRLLERAFVSLTDETYSTGALTILGELFDNVLQHSEASTAGFAGLQHYPNGKCIQTVISDNGLGIAGTLMPVLHYRYPDLATRVSRAEHPGIALLQELFATGRVSKVEEEGRGLGLKRSSDFALKFRAKLSVRQSDFELCVFRGPNGISFSNSRNLANIQGTHICFDFKLDGDRKAA